MLRPRSTLFALLVPVVFVLVAITSACSGSGEREVLQKYFSASRLRDNTTLGNIATVSFDPQQDGSVQSFSITNLGADQRRQLRVKELKKAAEEAKAADDAFTKRKKEYQDENLTVIDRVLKAERQNAKLKGKDVEVQAAWTKWREETAQHSKQLSEARSQLANERGVAELSVFDARRPIDLSEYDGEVISKDVTIAAKVRTAAGQVVNKNMVITLQRAEVKSPAGKAVSGRWIVTKIREAPAQAAKASS